MAFDAGMVACVAREINRLCRDGKVERVCQPTRDTVDITIHRSKENTHIYISASNNSPRISISGDARENPTTPPMFCMLLRKHLMGAKLISAEQMGFERVVKLTFSAYDDMGFPCKKSIIAEIMGRCSNIIFTHEDMRIISAVKTVDFSVSSKRQVIPGMRYELPPSQDKLDPTGLDFDQICLSFKKAAKDTVAYKYILSEYAGIAQAVAKEIVFRACGDEDALVSDISAERLASEFSNWFISLRNGDTAPFLIKDKNGVFIEYAYNELTFMNSTGENVRCESFYQMLDTFFFERERKERIKQRGSDILRIISNAKNRLTRKIQLQEAELADSEKGEEYKKYGDLIISNIYLIKKGDQALVCDDYCSEGCPKITVPLNPRMTPAQNAQKMYRMYNKAKSSKKHLTEQLAIARAELDYIIGVESFFASSENELDLIEIREELRNSGYAGREKATSSQKQRKNTITEYRTSGGYRILCGRNNIQNDYLTFNVASKGDLWFHVKGMQGSHVIMLCNGEEPTAADYTEAAECAAYYSSADRGSPVDVDYTRVKNIKKPPGAKPGYVIYHTNYSAYVIPKIPGKDKGNNVDKT